MTYLIAALCVITTATAILFPNTYETIAYAYPMKHLWQIGTGVFLHGAPDLPVVISVGHLVFNLLLVIPFGLMIEKTLGSKRFAFITLGVWIVNAIAFYMIAYTITPQGETAYGAGISGIAFSYGTIGAYLLYRLGKKNIMLLLKQMSFYFLLSIIMAMLAMVNPYVAGGSSMVIHIVAIIAGIIVIVWNRTVFNI